MPVVETEAVVLRTYRLAEADKIVVALTAAAGVVRGVARGARRVKSRFGASLEPWTICELTYFEKENRELVSLKSAEIIRSAFPLSRDPEIVGALEYMGELTLEFLPPHEVNKHMFRMAKACGEAAHERGIDVRRLVEYFEVWTLRLGGFLPSLKSCAECRLPLAPERGVVVDANGVARCAECGAGGKSVLSARAFSRAQAIQRSSPEQYALAGDSDAAEEENARAELQSLLRRLIVRALEREPRARGSRMPYAAEARDAAPKLRASGATTGGRGTEELAGVAE